MTINFIGSFTTGYVGETADEVHLVRELRALGHTVQEVPRDIWKAICDGERNKDWMDKLPKKADVNIICKWHHFNDEKYVNMLRDWSSGPVFYWTWDFMDYQNRDGFHYIMAKATDLLLTNDGFQRVPGEIKWHYFPFDVADGEIVTQFHDRKYDVVFFGSKLDQGDRVEWLQYLNKHIPVKVFSWNHEEWKKLGFDASPAVYGDDLAREVSLSKVIMGFNVNDYTWGYWSNRVGKILSLGGFLLQRYVPGMELSLGDAAEYFSSKEEMVEKAKYFSSNEIKNSLEHLRRTWTAYEVGQKFSSKQRVKELVIVIERYLKGGI